MSRDSTISFQDRLPRLLRASKRATIAAVVSTKLILSSDYVGFVRIVLKATRTSAGRKEWRLAAILARFVSPASIVQMDCGTSRCYWIADSGYCDVC